MSKIEFTTITYICMYVCSYVHNMAKAVLVVWKFMNGNFILIRSVKSWEVF